MRWISSENHQPLGVKLEIPHRVRKASGIAGILEIEVHAVRRLRRDVAGKRGLADLTRAKQRHGRRLPEVLQNTLLAASL